MFCNWLCYVYAAPPPLPRSLPIGDVARGFRSGQDLSLGSLYRRNVPIGIFHRHRWHRFQGNSLLIRPGRWIPYLCILLTSLLLRSLDRTLVFLSICVFFFFFCRIRFWTSTETESSCRYGIQPDRSDSAAWLTPTIGTLTVSYLRSFWLFLLIFVLLLHFFSSVSSVRRYESQEFRQHASLAGRDKRVRPSWRHHHAAR